MALGILSYLGILLVIPFLVSRNDPFVRFHLKQGMVLLVIEVILWILSGMFYGLISLINLLELGVIILAIIGIVNVLQRKEKELPLVGSFSKQLDPLFNAV
ncbi:MAG: hypothetical protein A2849_01690 [Candidatus Taylorbacteria bacterium RIFCSPHIGHO2_01_FULL_51_15]|uniref:Import component protein n=1 Tax=Candidatus Taylorbacteria bacterium RIFCSPHIGHO2_01_FULL_51_15 TaxID=1802304 RepID=A0A1G2MAZ3_9BACT|nr:MAG: hypothetical protein A2849_01690 [Candidatus Taylorbacteria bacterium RIFCSPHIGHO2_01_FULL_51_15]